MTSERILPLSEYHRLPQSSLSDDFYKRQLDVVCNNATLAMFIMDERQQCVYMNPAAETLTGYRLAEVKGRILHDVVHHTRPDGSPYPLCECPIDQAFPKNNQEQGEETFVHKEGYFYPVAYTASPIREQGKTIGTIIEIRDITQDKRDERARQELDRAKTEFFSNVSHEFRTPLTLMLAAVEDALLDRAEPLPKGQRERLEILQRNALRLLKLVNTLLDFSRVEANRMQAVFQPTDLAQLTADLASTFRAAIEQAGLTLTVECAELPEWVYVDRDLWEKIILNLLSNAFKFTFTGGITIRLNPVGDQVELQIQDTGVGIPVDALPHLFKRFHRISGTRSRTHEGSGIGLALVQELVKLHGGSIAVSSQVEVGTTFTVLIPMGRSHLPVDQVKMSSDAMRDRQPSSTAVRSEAFVQEAMGWLPEPLPESLPDAVMDGIDPNAIAPTITAASIPILVVDDNADLRNYLQRLLSPFYQVTTAVDGVDALQAIRQSQPRLVLCDVMMPNLDGYGVLRSLRSDPQTQDIPIILLSARAGEASRIEGLEAGADDYLIKPFSARELLARIEASLKLAELRQEAARREHELRLQAEAANRIKDEFLAVLSHELRSPLNPILGWAKLLQTRTFDEARTKEALATIERNARLQAELIEDLLDVSRILRGKLSLNVGSVDLKLAIQEAIDTVQLASDAKEVKIHTQFASGNWQTLGDASRLQQVFWNLLSNAIKFTPAGGRVNLTLAVVADRDAAQLDGSAKPPYAEITITDTGKGIAAEFLPHIFDYFRQEDATTTRKFGGLGLGLAIVHHLVELHGGTIQASSPGEGQGATFTVQLPLLTTQADRTQPESDIQEPQHLQHLNVLIVDDDRDSCELIAFVLEQHGATVTTADSALQALEQLKQSPPDLLISDIGMPEVDGYQLMRLVRSLPPEQGGKTIAIALTAYAGDTNYRQVIAAGFQYHIAKPIDPAQLVTQIASMRLVPHLNPSGDRPY